MAYKLEGSLLEVCNCEVLCPCWIGVDPDNGTCDTALAHHFEKGEIDGVDVSGLTLGFTAHVPGNILKGNWRAVVHIDRARHQGTGRSAAECLYRQARRSHRGPRPVDWRSSCGRALAHHVRG